MSALYLNLNELLPDAKVQSDLLTVLWEGKEECEIVLEEETLKVSSHEVLEVISKSYRCNVYQIGFGNYYAAQVAIGGVTKELSGILYPKYCFATLFYNSEKNLITTDVHSDMR